jgi:hypothetical protein
VASPENGVPIDGFVPRLVDGKIAVLLQFRSLIDSVHTTLLDNINPVADKSVGHLSGDQWRPHNGDYS